MRYTMILAAALVLAAAAAAAGAENYFAADRQFYPYYPSLIKWEKSGAEFTEPEVCAGCHPRQYEEWTASVHALAFVDPIYQGELNKGFQAVGHEVTRQCEGCHSPAGMVTDEVKGPGTRGLGRVALAGVSCDICHSISGVTHDRTPSREPENGSFILTPGRDTKEGPKLVKRGPDKPADGCGGGFHECVESPLFELADLCAGCHQVYQYEYHFPLESTYLEWKHGPYAQRNIHCKDCHMVENAVFVQAADSFRKPVDEEYRHYFGGVNYLLHHLGGAAAKKAGDAKMAARFAKMEQMAVEKLQAAAAVELFPFYRNGALAEVQVRVKNIRAGHNLPTSLTNVREMWLEVTAKDASGAVVLASGGFDRSGSLVPGTRLFNSEGMGMDFHFAIDPWIVTAFSRHDTIPPRGYKDAWYAVSPEAKPGPVAVEARLRYRQADQKVAQKILKSVPESIDLEKTYGIDGTVTVPVVDMVVKKASFDSRKK